MKVIINTDFGGFGISQRAFELYRQRAGLDKLPEDKWDDDYRNDPIMVSIIEEIGLDADDPWSCLEIVEIPDEYDYAIHEYDGLEWVELRIQEDHLRELIQIGNEDDIVEYVKRTQDRIYGPKDEKEETEC